MENPTKGSQESLKPGLFPNDDVLLTNCEDSVDSQDLRYGLIQKTENIESKAKEESSLLPTRSIPDQFKSDCEYFLIKEYPTDDIQDPRFIQTTVRSVPRFIAPKIPNENGTNLAVKEFVIEPYKKRDAKKRATHREVERRRRDKINTWILKLKELIPESSGIKSPNYSSTHKTNAHDSKSEILVRACDYIKEMQEELKSLRECLVENDTLRLNNQRLQFEMDKLKNHNSQPIDKVVYINGGQIVKEEIKDV